MKFACIPALAYPPLFTALEWLFACCRLDLDQLLSALTRGFAGGSFWNRLRRRPATALVALLERRLRTFDPKAVVDRRGRAERLWNLLPAVERPGAAATDHTQWVLPVACPNPQQLVRQLRARGYDASQRASSLELLADASAPKNSSWNRLVYLPHHPQMVPNQLAAVAAPLLESK
jgi:perosamine synthetase